jgi:hypothetical protein
MHNIRQHLALAFVYNRLGITNAVQLRLTRLS